MWKSGISVVESVNHYTKAYDVNRISLMFMMVSLLSQPLFHTADEYLVILNPFATYLTCRRSKNVKNLFISLLNVVISYDCTGYVSDSCISHDLSLGYPIRECNRYVGRDRDAHYISLAPNLDLD